MIIELASSIDNVKILQDIFKLYDVELDSANVILMLDKMEYKFLKVEPLDHDYIRLMESLMEA